MRPPATHGPWHPGVPARAPCRAPAFAQVILPKSFWHRNCILSEALTPSAFDPMQRSSSAPDLQRPRVPRPRRFVPSQFQGLSVAQMTRMAADYQDLNARLAHLGAQVKWRNDVQERLVEQNMELMAQQQRFQAELSVMQQHLVQLHVQLVQQLHFMQQPHCIRPPPGLSGAGNAA